MFKLIQEALRRLREMIKRLIGLANENNLSEEDMAGLKNVIQRTEKAFEVIPALICDDPNAKEVLDKINKMTDLAETYFEKIKKDPENAAKYVKEFTDKFGSINDELGKLVFKDFDICETIGKAFFGVSVNGQTLESPAASTAENPFGNGNRCALYTLKDKDGEERIILALNDEKDPAKPPHVSYMEIDKETGKPGLLKKFVSEKDKADFEASLTFASDNSEFMKKMLPVMTFMDKDINTGCARFTIGTMSVAVPNTMSEVPEALMKMELTKESIDEVFQNKSDLYNQEFLDSILAVINIPEEMRNSEIEKNIKKINAAVSSLKDNQGSGIHFSDASNSKAVNIIKDNLSNISNEMKAMYQQAAFVFDRENMSQISPLSLNKNRQNLGSEDPNAKAISHCNAYSAEVSADMANKAKVWVEKSQMLTDRIPKANTEMIDQKSGIVGMRLKRSDKPEDVRFYDPESRVLIRCERGTIPMEIRVYQNIDNIAADLENAYGVSALQYDDSTKTMTAYQSLKNDSVQQIMRTDFVLNCFEGAFIPRDVLTGKLNEARDSQSRAVNTIYQSNIDKLNTTMSEFEKFIDKDVLRHGDSFKCQHHPIGESAYVIEGAIRHKGINIPIHATVGEDARTITKLAVTIGNTNLELDAGNNMEYNHSLSVLKQTCVENGIRPETVMPVVANIVKNYGDFKKDNQKHIRKEEKKDAKETKREAKREKTGPELD